MNQTYARGAVFLVRQGSLTHDWLKSRRLRPGSVIPFERQSDILVEPIYRDTAAWSCAYCGGMQVSDLYRCVSCGAPRR